MKINLQTVTAWIVFTLTVTMFFVALFIWAPSSRAADVTGTFELQLNFVHVDTNNVLSSARQRVGSILTQAITAGTNANQMNLFFQDQRSLTNSEMEELDLSGVLIDSFGATQNFAEVRMLIIDASILNSNTLTVGNASTNEWFSWAGGTNHTQKVRPGGSLILWAPGANGFVVTNAASDLLGILNDSSFAASYNIYIAGSDN